MEVYIALACLLLTIWVKFRLDHLSIFKKLGIPGPKPNLLFGNLLELYFKGPLNCQQGWTNKYGKVLGYFYGMNPVLLVSDPMLLKNIFIKDFHKFMNREAFNPLYHNDPHSKKSHCIFVLEGQKWKEVRTILTPTFTTAKMKQMSPSMHDSVDLMLLNLEKKSSSGSYVDVYDSFQRLTMDIITRTAFGIMTDVQTNPKSSILKLSRTFFRTPYRSIIVFVGLSFPWLRRLCLKIQNFILRMFNRGKNPYVVLPESLRKVLIQRRSVPKTSSPDLLQLMIDATIPSDREEVQLADLEAGNEDVENKMEESSGTKGRSMTDEEIIAHAYVVLLAGYETTSTVLGFTAYLLSQHQDVQERLYQEIQNLAQDGEKLEYATINRLQYMDQVLNESMRLYPPFVLFTNRYAMEDVEYENLRIPKGMLIQAPVYVIHHHPDHWPDPETFDPERFNKRLDTNAGIRYMPFSAGPRNCLGMRFAQLEAKLALAKLLHRFKILPVPGEEKLRTRIKLRILAPYDEIKVKIEKRNLHESNIST